MPRQDSPAGGGNDGQAPTREVVILWGERLTAGPSGAAGARALLGIAGALGMAGTDGAGLLEVPACTNGRGLREAGVLPNAGPGLCQLGGEAGDTADREVVGRIASQDSSPRRARDRRGPRRGRAERAVPAPRRPAARAARPRAVGARAGRREHGRRARLVPDRGHPRARRRRLPGRGLRREGGHDRPPRRAPAAPAPRDRAAGAPCARSGGCSPSSPCGSASTWTCSAARWPRSGCSRPCPSTPGSRSRRSAARGVRWQERAGRVRVPAGGGEPAPERGRVSSSPTRARGRAGAGRLPLGVGRPRGASSRRRWSSCSRARSRASPLSYAGEERA